MEIQPSTIDDIIRQLEELITECLETGDRIGYFASLYLKVTVRVRQGIQANEFEDGPRMEKLDVQFANRFLQAIWQWKNKKKPSGPWQVTFEAAKKSSPLILQQLLLGINAHINFDLGIAAAVTSGDQDIRKIRNDFNCINTILSSLIFEVLNDLNRVSPLLSLFGLHATNDSILIQFSMVNARDGAWSFAEELNSKKGNDYDACLTARDESIKKLAVSLIHPTGLIRLTKWIIHLFEWKNPKKIIRVFNEHQKKYIHV